MNKKLLVAAQSASAVDDGKLNLDEVVDAYANSKFVVRYLSTQARKYFNRISILILILIIFINPIFNECVAN